MQTLTLEVESCVCDLCTRETQDVVYKKLADSWKVWFFCSDECCEEFFRYWADVDPNPMLTVN